MDNAFEGAVEAIRLIQEGRSPTAASHFDEIMRPAASDVYASPARTEAEIGAFEALFLALDAAGARPHGPTEKSIRQCMEVDQNGQQRSQNGASFERAWENFTELWLDIDYALATHIILDRFLGTGRYTATELRNRVLNHATEVTRNPLV